VFCTDDTIDADFVVVVEDPGFSWTLSIYDRHGRLVEQLNWSGCLSVGIEKAVEIMHKAGE
jgi:hypothetical protein